MSESYCLGETLIAKNQNTYAKRKREMEKKEKAEAKRVRRVERKQDGGPGTPVVPMHIELDDPQGVN